jgi:hypothetical protein
MPAGQVNETMATNLKNQVARVTGASSSIGEAVQPLGYRAIPRHPPT